MLVLTYKCVNKCSSPAYLQDLLNKYKPGRTLRSSEDTTRLHIPSYNDMDGQRSFSVAHQKCGMSCLSDFEKLTMFLRLKNI